jgi:UrcA family protein
MNTLTASTHLPRLLKAATILGLLAFGCAAQSVADDNSRAPRHALVKFGDLNLWNPDGAAALYRRIYAAAYEVCGSFHTRIADLPDPSEHDACMHDAVRNAVAAVNQPALSAIYNARNTDPLPIPVVAAQNR